MNSIFIPKKIKVGYQDRGDTYTKRLAYVVYYDNKGVLRKEKSWEGWRDKGIAPEEYDNTPQSGFVLNKHIQRFNWSHFGSSRTMIRIYDPRGIEFEITAENLIGILLNTTCTKKGFDGEFVYAWVGSELVVLPTCSEEYQSAVTYTALQDQKVSAKTLVPGAAYRTKKSEDLIYLGRFEWHEWDDSYRATTIMRSCAKKHIFIDAEDIDSPKPKLIIKSDASFLALCTNPVAVQNYAEIVERLKMTYKASKIASIVAGESNSIEVTIQDQRTGCWDHATCKINGEAGHNFAGYDENTKIITYYTAHVGVSYQSTTGKTDGEYVIKGYYIQENGSFDTQKMAYTVGNGRGYYNFVNSGDPYYWHSDHKILTKEDFERRVMATRRPVVTYENGQTQVWNNSRDMYAERANNE